MAVEGGESVISSSLIPRVVLPLATVAVLAGCGSSSSSPSGAATQFEIIRSQSSCQEAASTTSVNCSIGVKNRGTSEGVPVVYALYHYSDGGSGDSDASNNGECGASDPIPAGQLGFVYFCHPYKALQYDVTEVAVSLNLSASYYTRVSVASPDDPNWPSG